MEILGEAAKNVSSDIRTLWPDVPWQEMSRMRDKLIHGYFGIDSEIVWKTIKDDLPEILPVITKICLEYHD